MSEGALGDASAARPAGMPGLPELPGLPRDDGGPVFGEPWQAHAFALAVALHRQGLFTWPEWTQTLARQIQAAQADGDADLGDTYYRHWLDALETLAAEKGATGAKELARLRHAWGRAAARTPHGQPIELEPEDFDA